MMKLTRILRDYEDSDSLSAKIGITAAIDRETFLTTSGDLLVVLAVHGPDAECLEPDQLNDTARRFESALRTLNPHFRLYQFLLKRNDPPLPSGTYSNPVVHEAAHARLSYLQAKSSCLYSTEIFWAVSYEGWRSGKAMSQKIVQFMHEPRNAFREFLSPHNAIAVLDEGLIKAGEILRNKVISFIVQLPEPIQARVLNKDEAFVFLRRLLNYAPHITEGARLKYDDHTFNWVILH